MHIVHVSRWRLPVTNYGGVPRVIYWLAKAQAEQGHRVTILGPPGTTCPGVRTVAVPVSRAVVDYSPHIGPYVPADANVVHFHHLPSVPPPLPWVLTVNGNSPAELQYRPMNIYVSRDHARRGGASVVVYNGIDPGEFIYRERKDDYFLFLSKVSRPAKGVDIALRLAREMGFRLVVAGGSRLALYKAGGFWNSVLGDVHFCGMVTGQRKADLLAGARALIFPIRWEEPFGLVVTEALVSGTPVITTPRGSMPELVTPDVGFLCGSYEELKAAIRRVENIDPAACRQRVMEHFTSAMCARNYARYYERAIAGLPLETPGTAAASAPSNVIR
jgi:glycosyltransferase involved in cell wall biosynthesis